MLFGGSDDGNTPKDDWFVEASDEEGDDKKIDQSEPWSPDAKDILSMFAELKEKKVLELSWTCPGRRPPSPEKGTDEEEAGEEENMYSDDDIKEEETKVPEASEFDFDDFGMEASTKMTPRRTPGSKSTPKSQKKVACMDNVLNKIRHQQKEKAALKEARRGMSRSPASPARFRLGMTGSPGGAGSPRCVLSSSGTPLRAPQSDDPFPTDSSVFSKDSKVSTHQPDGAGSTEAQNSPSPAAQPTASVAEVKPND